MQNSRRDFLRNTALAGLALSVPFKKELFAMANPQNAFGIQLWTVKEALAKDPLAVLKHLSASGYKQIESFEGDKGIFWGMKNTAFKKTMDDLGMKIVSAHCDNTKDFERKAAEAGEIGMKYLICPYKGPQKTIDHYKRFADEFNACGEIAKKNVKCDSEAIASFIKERYDPSVPKKKGKHKSQSSEIIAAMMTTFNIPKNTATTYFYKLRPSTT